MNSSHLRFEQLIDHLSSISGTNFPIIDSSCTLIDSNTNDEKVVIELPEGSDLLMLHRLISPLPVDTDTSHARALQLLALNGQPDKLQGAWFCIDPNSQGIHLMLSQPIEQLNVQQFENLVFNYVTLADQIVQEIKDDELDASGTSNPLIGGIPV